MANKKPTPAFVSDQVPLYYQLHNVLANQIASGALAAGGRIPTEAELVDEYGVSRITVRQALQMLEQQGLIRREVGRGTFVSEQQHFNRTLKLEGSMDDLISLGLATSVRLIKLITRKATREEAATLRLEPDAMILYSVRLRLHGNEPYCHVVNTLPFEIGSRLERKDWKGAVSRALEEKLKIPLVEAQQTIRASLADSELARMLKTSIGAPLLEVDRLVFSDAGRPVNRVRTHYRSDVFSFTVHLSRAHPHTAWALKPGTKNMAAKVGGAK